MPTKVAIITGASSGMGAATAKLLAKNGIKVMMAARRGERLQQLCNEIISEGGDAATKLQTSPHTQTWRPWQIKRLKPTAKSTS